MYICIYIECVYDWAMVHPVQSQVTNTSSQDSIQDGLSPDMSDYDHSSELDNDPREIHVPKTSSNFGETTGFIQLYHETPPKVVS